MTIQDSTNEHSAKQHYPQEAVLGRLGNLVVKIADSSAEIEAALRLRHRVFHEDIPGAAETGARDEDRFDAHCDHLIVLDVSNGEDSPQMVATYRLLGQEAAALVGGFYSQNEFRISELTSRHPDLRFLEFGRSCVLPRYRSKRTIELLWHGSWAYVRKNAYDVMFGCASFPGTNPEIHREALAFLAANAGPQDGWQTKGCGEVVPMAAASKSVSKNANLKSVMRSLPPLIKGYLRLGAMFADEAVIDRDFGTIDVLVLLPISRLNPRYVNYYGEDAVRYAR